DHTAGEGGVVVEGDGSRAVVLVLGDGAEVTLWHVDGRRAPDLTLVDAVARLHLAARRRGWSVRARNPCPDLLARPDPAGLAGLPADPRALPLEARGQAEEGEQLGVEEVVEPRDPPL